MRTTRTVRVNADGATLAGELSVPRGASALVVFVTGGCGTPHARRERRVADLVRSRGIGTLLIDLVAIGELPDRSRRHDVALLAERLEGVLAWLRTREETGSLAVGFYGADTGGAAVVRVLSAADLEDSVAATVDGRFDHEGAALDALDRPLLFVVTADTEHLQRHTREAYDAVGTDARDKHVLWADGDDDAVYVTAGWFESRLPGPETRPGFAPGSVVRARPVGPRESS